MSGHYRTVKELFDAVRAGEEDIVTGIRMLEGFPLDQVVAQYETDRINGQSLWVKGFIDQQRKLNGNSNGGNTPQPQRKLKSPIAWGVFDCKESRIELLGKAVKLGQITAEQSINACMEGLPAMDALLQTTTLDAADLAVSSVANPRENSTSKLPNSVFTEPDWLLK